MEEQNAYNIDKLLEKAHALYNILYKKASTELMITKNDDGQYGLYELVYGGTSLYRNSLKNFAIGNTLKEALLSFIDKNDDALLNKKTQLKKELLKINRYLDDIDLSNIDTRDIDGLL